MEEATILEKFLDALIEDHKQSGVRPLDQPLPRFPGQAELIANEYLAFKAREAAATGAPAPAVASLARTGTDSDSPGCDTKEGPRSLQ